jgi:CubicO group peptidase (beta-lactamase class C family)
MLIVTPALAEARLPKDLEAYVEASMAAWEVPGLAVAVVHADDAQIAEGFGVRRMGRPEKVDADTVFNIASLTKSFTAAGVAALVDDGRMAWDDPVTRWLPEVRFSDPWLTEHVTVADLLSHRTGLQPANTMFRFTGIDRAEVVRRVRYLKPAAPFRTEQVYNNVLYTLAGETAAAAAGTSYEELIRTRIIAPLGMGHTTVSIAPDPAGNVAVPHAVIDGRQQPIRPVGYISIAPAGGMSSTARDMTRWLRFQLGDGTWEGKRIVSAASMQAMHEPQVLIPTTPEMRANRQVEFFAGYGFGWNVMDYRGHKLLWHSGNADGMPSYMALLPNERIGVLVMLDTWKAPILHGDIAARILDHYLGLPTRDYAAETLAWTIKSDAKAAAEAKAGAARATAEAAAHPPMAPAAYEGTYADDLFGPVIVAREGAGLVLRMGKGEAADLAPAGRDGFTVRWRDRVLGEDNDTRATFTVVDGRATRLSMKMRRDQIEAARVPE